MISRFHFMLELGCKSSNGKIELAVWRQGADLHADVVDSETGQLLPHRPDAFFSLRFPDDPEGHNKANFFYEADRKTASTPKLLAKFRAHLEFIRQGKHQGRYDVRRIRAVLIETLDIKWANELRLATARICSSPVFWFTASELFTLRGQPENRTAQSPVFLSRPQTVLQRIWATTTTDELLALTD
jgi:hypothetical protein